MPDYSACRNADCRSKNMCCRYLMDIAGTYRQPIALMTGNGDDCDLFWPVNSGAPFRLRQLTADESEEVNEHML